MTFKTLASLFLIGSLALTLGGTKAQAWPMDGIDTTLVVRPNTMITLKDKDGQPLVLSGTTYPRFRFSNASKSFHIMMNPSHKQEFKVAGGFPGGDLRNFYLPGSSFGNTVDLEGRTTEQLIDRRLRRDIERCTWTCGWDRICSGQGPGRVCREVPRTCYGTREREYEEELRQRDFSLMLTEPTGRELLARAQGVVSREWVTTYSRIIYDSCRY